MKQSCRRREEDEQRQQLLGRQGAAGVSWQSQVLACPALLGTLAEHGAWVAVHKCFLMGVSVSGQAFASQEDAEAAARSSIQQSKRTLEETFQTGAGILTGMADQRERLKVCTPDLW